MFTIETIDDLWEHIAYTQAYAPDRFPYRDFIPADDQMNLERAFEQLRLGVSIAYPESSFAEKRAELLSILYRSLAAYRNSQELEAARMLNDFQDGIFKRND